MAKPIVLPMIPEPDKTLYEHCDCGDPARRDCSRCHGMGIRLKDASGARE